MLLSVALVCAIGTVGYSAYIGANITIQERLLFDINPGAFLSF